MWAGGFAALRVPAGASSLGGPGAGWMRGIPMREQRVNGRRLSPNGGRRRGARGGRCALSGVVVMGAVGVATLAGGCAGPFDYPYERGEGLRRGVISSIERDLGEAVDLGVEVGGSGPDAEALAGERLGFGGERLEELERMAGPNAEGYEGVPELGPGLLGEGAREELVRVGLEEVVLSAVRNNLDVRVARFGPAIEGERLVEAEAAFDFVVFGGADYTSSDVPQQAPPFNPTTASVSEDVGVDFGLRKLLTTGGLVTLTNEYGYSDNNTPDFVLEPDPASSGSVSLRLEQPLLRGFGREVNLAQVRLAENTRRASVQDLRESLRQTVLDVERAYWELAFAERDLKIRQRLLERGIEVRDVLKERLDAEFDVRPAEYSDAVATVERRRSDIISAQNRLRLASDLLKLLVDDARFPVAGGGILLASERADDERVRVALRDAALAAVGGRPAVLQAALGIGAADINLAVAENDLLPDLDLLLEADYAGLDTDADGAYQEVFAGEFVTTIIGLRFERAIGNRREEGAFTRRRLERLRSAAAYQRVARLVLDEVKSALRNLETSYRLIEQSRVSRLAAAENLRTLMVEKELTRALTADFLNLEFTRQEQLALAEIEEARALSDYAISRAEVDAATAQNLDRHGIEFVVPEADPLLEASPLAPLIEGYDLDEDA